MDVKQAILLGFQLSVVLSVFAIGLGTSRGDLVSLFGRPGLLVRSLFATQLLMLLTAVLLVKLIHPPHLVAIALIALALAPMPPVLPKSMIKASGEASYAAGLLAFVAVLSLIWIPVAGEALGPIFRIDLHIPFEPVVKLIAITILAPLIAGSLLARLAPAFAAQIEHPVAVISGLLLTAAFLVIVVQAWGGIADQAYGGAVLALVLFSLVGLVVGHVLGGPIEDDRTVLALACAQRHPGVVIVLGKIVAPDEAGIGLVALLSLIVATLCCVPYIAWRKRRAAAAS